MAMSFSSERKDVRGDVFEPDYKGIWLEFAVFPALLGQTLGTWGCGQVLNGICKFLVTGPCGAGASVSFFSGVGGGRRWSKRSWVRGSELKGRVRGLWPINVGVEELCGSFFRDSGQRSCQA